MAEWFSPCDNCSDPEGCELILQITAAELKAYDRTAETASSEYDLETLERTTAIASIFSGIAHQETARGMKRRGCAYNPDTIKLMILAAIEETES